MTCVYTCTAYFFNDIMYLHVYTLFSPYMENGFINLQRIVEQSIIAFITQGETTVDVDISMRVREGIERRGMGRAFIIVQCSDGEGVASSTGSPPCVCNNYCK